jgi:uncharacterized DUF497 family protein
VQSDRFEWDDDKAAVNFQLHGIIFEKVFEIFDDPLGVTFADHSHSTDEDREVTIGTTFFDEVLVVSHVTRGGRTRIISARRATKAERRKYMNKQHDYISDKKELEDDLLPEYDFDYSKGVRGKYYTGRRLIIYIRIDEDVAKYFSTNDAVNTALRQLIAEGRAPAPRTE